MGLFDKLSGDSVMGWQDFFFLDDDQKKLKICREAGERMAPAIGGTVKIRDGGDEVHVTGQFGQYPVRAIIWVTFANLRVQLKALRPVSGELSLRYDEDAAKHAGEQLDRDAWDQDEDEKLFLSKAVYVEGSRNELRRAKQLYDQLPPELMTPLLQWLESSGKSGPSFRLGGESLDLYLNDSNITLSKTSAQRFYGLLQLLTAILASAEERWSRGGAHATPLEMARAAAMVPVAIPPVVATPGPPPAPPQGPPAGPPPGTPAFLPGTPVLVSWSDGNRYPATALQSAPGQYLCSFPNGQEQWVGAPYVAPA